MARASAVRGLIDRSIARLPSGVEVMEREYATVVERSMLWDRPGRDERGSGASGARTRRMQRAKDQA
jgi:hypothetical protein